jgi:hypothetical protein
MKFVWRTQGKGSLPLGETLRIQKAEADRNIGLSKAQQELDYNAFEGGGSTGLTVNITHDLDWCLELKKVRLLQEHPLCCLAQPQQVLLFEIYHLPWLLPFHREAFR